MMHILDIILAVELSEYNIDFVPTSTIKDQAIADFIVELTIMVFEATCVFEVDGSICNSGASIGLRIIIPDQRTYEHSICL